MKSFKQYIEENMFAVNPSTNAKPSKRVDWSELRPSIIGDKVSDKTSMWQQQPIMWQQYPSQEIPDWRRNVDNRLVDKAFIEFFDVLQGALTNQGWNDMYVWLTELRRNIVNPFESIEYENNVLVEVSRRYRVKDAIANFVDTLQDAGVNIPEITPHLNTMVQWLIKATKHSWIDRAKDGVANALWGFNKFDTALEKSPIGSNSLQRVGAGFKNWLGSKFAS